MSSDDHSTVIPSPTSPPLLGITVIRPGGVPAGTTQYNSRSTQVDPRRIQLFRDIIGEFSPPLGTDETAYLTSILQEHRHALNQNNATVPPQQGLPSTMNRGTPHLHQLFHTASNLAPTRQFMFIYVYPTHGEMILSPLLGQRVVLYLPQPDAYNTPLELIYVTQQDTQLLTRIATGFTITSDRPLNQTIRIQSNLQREQLILTITALDQTPGVPTLGGGQDHLITWYLNEIIPVMVD